MAWPNFKHWSWSLTTYRTPTTRNQLRVAFESGKGVKGRSNGVKKIKWTYFNTYICQTMWNHAKRSMKKLKRPNSLLQGEVSSAVLKTWKTRETKTRITQNFQILYHIQDRAMWKLTSRGFRKCGSFCAGEFLKGTYWLSKLGHFSFFFDSKMRCPKKRHGHNFVMFFWMHPY